MKFNKKKVWTITGIVVGIIVVLLVIVYFSLSVILKSSVQTFGSMVLGVPVTVDRIDLKPFSGALAIRNLTVGNPEGYSSPHAFKLGKFDVVLVPSSLFGKKMIIDNLAVDGMELNYETNLLRSNLSDIQNNINRLSKGSSSSASAEKQEKTEEQAAESKPLQINRLDLSDIKIYTILKGREDTRVVPLMAPPVHLQDLGTEPEGITPVEVMSKVMTTLLTNVAKALADGTMDVGNLLGDGASSAGSKMGEGLENTGKAVDGFLKGLLGGKEEKK